MRHLLDKGEESLGIKFKFCSHTWVILIFDQSLKYYKWYKLKLFGNINHKKCSLSELLNGEFACPRKICFFWRGGWGDMGWRWWSLTFIWFYTRVNLIVSQIKNILYYFLKQFIGSNHKYHNRVRSEHT